MRTSMAQLTPRFSTNRMLRDYLDNYYLPAARQYQQRMDKQGALAQELRLWQQHLARHWHEIHLGKLTMTERAGNWLAETQVYLGGIAPEQVAIEMIADPVGEVPAECIRLQLAYPLTGAINAYHYQGVIPQHRPVSDWSLRAIACHPNAQVPAENPLICWAD